MNPKVNEIEGVIEANAPPLPHRTYKLPPRPRSIIRFDLIPVGQSARYARAERTVRGKLTEYRKTAASEGQRFVIRPITPTLTRVWRVK